jgi:hypothetical protein
VASRTTTTAGQWLAEYNRKAREAAKGGVSDELLSVQARRAALLVGQLAAGKALVLPDPVGTGKTAVALVAAGMLLEAEKVRRVVVVAPNAVVRKLWEDRVKWLVSPSTGKASPGKAFRIVTRKKLVDERRPVAPEGILVVVDEAHRGLQSEGEFHDRLEKWAKGCQVLLVTATPFQLSSQGLTTMLGIGQAASDTGKTVVEAYGEAVMSLAKAYRAAVQRSAVDPVKDPAVVAATERAVEKRPAAADVLGRRILSPDLGLSALRKEPPALKKFDLKVSPEWQEAYHVARVVPELVGTGKGDMFNRRLFSCSEAFWGGKAGRELCQRAEKSPAVDAFAVKLRRALGQGSHHPKVAATADWVAAHWEQGRHVLVFCVFFETQQALGVAIAGRVGEASVKAPKGAAIDPNVVDQFQSTSLPRLVLVLQDRFSESIDLDGGHPCIVHHDLPWTPARVTQRWGRVVRAGSGFKPVAQTDIFVPVLDLDADKRLFDTVKARAGIGDLLLPRSVLADTEDPDEYSLPDTLLDRLRPMRGVH